MLILIIAGGPDKGRIYELLEGKDIVLGREGDQVKLNDRKVSREHAKLWCEGGQWYIQDLGSRHGTHRNHKELEKGSTAKLKDGDYIQVGSTVMVMGRMPAEHAERLAMLGQQSAEVPGWRRPGLLVGGGVAAAVALIGLSGYGIYKMDLLSGHNDQRDSQYAQLQQALIDSQQQNAEATRKLQETLAARSRVEEALLDRLADVGGDLDDHADAVARATGELHDINRPLLAQMELLERRAQEQQVALERMGEMLAHEAETDNSEAVMALLTELQTEFADQPDGDELVRRLSVAISNNAEATGEAVRSALADFRAEDTPLAAAERTEALVARVLTALESVPSSEAIAQEVLAGIGNPYAAQEAMMREILAEYRGTREQIEQTVASAMNEDASQAQRLMVQVMAELDKQPDGEVLAAQLRDAMEQAAAGNADADANLAALMQQVLTEFENRPTAEQLAQELREAVGEDAQRTQQLMAQVLEELSSQPTAAQNAAQTTEMMQAILARIDEQNELAGEVAQLRAMIQERPEGSDALIEAAIARLDQQSRNSARNSSKRSPSSARPCPPMSRGSSTRSCPSSTSRCAASRSSPRSRVPWNASPRSATRTRSKRSARSRNAWPRCPQPSSSKACSTARKRSPPCSTAPTPAPRWANCGPRSIGWPRPSPTRIVIGWTRSLRCSKNANASGSCSPRCTT
ncbi:FHA domain-containing protein [Phycisphaeraceae bacterium D3-23]